MYYHTSGENLAMKKCTQEVYHANRHWQGFLRMRENYRDQVRRTEARVVAYRGAATPPT